MKTTDWSTRARVMAKYVGENMMPAHRGVMPIGRNGLCVVFGNDDYDQDERAQKEVEAVRQYIGEEEGIEELAFATADDGYTWGMLVNGTTGHMRHINDVLWSAWDAANCERAGEHYDPTVASGYRVLQSAIARDVILKEL